MKSCLPRLALALFLPGFALAQAPAPKLLPFQARLTDQTGTAVPNGTRLVQFKIYAVPTGGSPVWAGELHKTTVNGGLINVLLGSKTPFSGVNFDQTLYLEVTADLNADTAISSADAPMLPRQVILPAVFAKESADSRQLAGFDWTPIFGTNSPTGPIPGGKLAPNSIDATQIARGAIGASQVAPGAISLTNLASLVAEALNPPGSILAFGGKQTPGGWLPCDGRPLSAAAYPRLFEAIGTAWGAGYQPTTGESPERTGDFNLPDLRGLFLRGRSADRADGLQDPDASSRTNRLGGSSGNAIGSLQADLTREHTHGIHAEYFQADSGDKVTGYILEELIQNNPSQLKEAVASGGSETRPKNAYVNYIIKY